MQCGSKWGLKWGVHRPQISLQISFSGLTHNGKHISSLYVVVNARQKLTRGPYGANKALQAAKQVDENSIDRILLKKGDVVWLTYYAAKKATEIETPVF
ncbi:hypothetical protein RRF57_012234 [Xylaria bambusicola]|uniref:Uncharacterized protein n=1 Tax=Xylaria bambusicola TaxID=326684 RepID=A0AAN7UUV8_9PEZI